MKSLAHRSLSRIAGTLSGAALGVWCLAGSAVGVPATPPLPAAGNGFAVSLAASWSYPLAGQSVTLTATTSTDVGPAPYYVTIYSETTGAELAVCGTGTTCSATVSQTAAGSQVFEAFLGDDVPGNGHPGFVLASSNEVPVTWWWLIFHGPHHRVWGTGEDGR